MKVSRRHWNSLDKIIVDLLCSRSALSCFELYQKLGFSPLSIADTAQRLSIFGLANRYGDSLERTPEFFDRLLVLRHRIYHRRMPWKAVDLDRHKGQTKTRRSAS